MMVILPFLIMLVAMVCILALSALFSALETSIYAANKTRLAGLQAKGNSRAATTLKLLGKLPSLLVAMLIGNNLCVDAGSHIMTGYLEDAGYGSAEAWTTIILTPVFFIFAESLPKRLAYTFSNELLISSVRLIILCKLLFWPLSVILNLSSTIIRRVLKRFGLKAVESTGKSQIIEKLEAEAAEGSLAEEQYEMARRIIDLECLTVSEVMLPCSDAVLVEAKMSCEQAGKKIIQSGYARGLLMDHAGQLTGRFVTLNAILRNPGSLEQQVDSVAEDAMHLSGRTPVMKAMNRMRKNGVRLAIATGPGGAAVGVVPFRKLLGCVTGDLKI